MYPPSTNAPAGGTSKGRRWLWGVLALALAIALLIMMGPRNTLGPDQPSVRANPPQAIEALEPWLANSEAQFSDIKPGNAKGIVWAHPTKKRTPWAVVYLHGFSASRLETAPVSDRVAQALGANLFYTRLSGHGRADPAAMGQANAQDWMADALEAVRIGKTLGERVLLVSCSTGSTLATWLTTSAQGQLVDAQVFLSPNFGPKDKRSEIINGPWGMRIAVALEGEYRSWTPANAEEANGWTSRYPTKALFPMMALVKSVRDSDLSIFQTPVLMLYSEKDETVDPLETQSAFSRIGSERKSMIEVAYSHSKGQHVLAGAIKDPQAVDPMVTSIVQWMHALPPQKPTP